MTNLVFELNQLNCSYHTHSGLKEVLHIDSLSIPRGELIYVLGASGTGKSTLLEALGLMNKTIAGGELNFYGQSGRVWSLGQLWNEDSGASEVASLRSREFSFIFQEANFLPHYTNYENVIFPLLLQEDGLAISRMEDRLEALHLPNTPEFKDRLPRKTSLGQRQRLAFIRALLPSYSVLFADEPTGNLDEENAFALMNELKEDLLRKKKSEPVPPTAIVVSHDIELAYEFADRILVITHDPNQKVGTIRDEHNWDRASFKKYSLDGFKAEVKKLYSPTISPPPPKIHTLSPQSGEKFSLLPESNDEFITGESQKLPPHPKRKARQGTELFIHNEHKNLLRARRRELSLLAGVCLIAFIGIGFGKGILDYLNMTLDNPMNRWVPLNMYYASNEKSSQEVISILDSNKLEEWIGSEDLLTYRSAIGMPFWNEHTQQPLKTEYRTISKTDPIIQSLLLNRKNLPQEYAVNRDSPAWGGELRDLSLIVTKGFMEKFGYDRSTRFISFVILNVPIGPLEVDTIKVPVPITAVIEAFPENEQVGISIPFFQAIWKFDPNPFEKAYLANENKYLYLCVQDHPKLASFWQLLSDEKEFLNLKSVQEIKTRKDWFTTPNYVCPYENRIRLTIHGNTPKEVVVKGIERLASENFEDLVWEETYDYKLQDIDEDDFNRNDANKIAFYLEDINQAEDFQNFIDTTLNDYALGSSQERPTKLEIARIRDKKNYGILSILTQAFGLSLFVVAGIALFAYVSAVLQSHIGKLYPELGTLQAFGFPKQAMIGAYLRVFLQTFGIIVAGSFILAIGIGELVDLGLGVLVDRPNNSFFSLFNWLGVLSFFLVLGLIALTTRNALSKLFTYSPGDLVYRREETKSM